MCKNIKCSIEQMHEVQLGLLKEFKRVCEKNGIRYYLASLLWCILLIVLPIALVFSESSMNNIQSISIISAFPIGIIMIIMIWGFIKDIKIYMKKELKGKEWQNN